MSAEQAAVAEARILIDEAKSVIGTIATRQHNPPINPQEAWLIIQKVTLAVDCLTSAVQALPTVG